MRIAVVTDTHLAPEAPAFNRNWRAVRAFVKSANADLTIHLGDVTVDGLGDPTQFRHVLEISAAWPTPIRYVPGNHDIGDNPPGPGITASQPLDRQRRAEFEKAFGSDHWSFEAEGWRLVGLNAQLLGSETPEEAAQWAWLERLAADSRGRPVVLLLHKPLFQESPADEKPHHRYVPAAPRRRLREVLGRVDLRAVVSGHTHQYRDREIDHVRHLWLPSTAFYFPDQMQDRIGEKVVGLGLLELGPDALQCHLVCPEGVIRNNVLDFADYPRLLSPRHTSPKLDRIH